MDFLVNSDKATSPSVAALADGGWIVTWGGRGVGEVSGIFGQRYDGGAVGEASFRQTIE